MYILHAKINSSISKSQKIWRHKKFPWPYLKFPDFSRFTKFPDNSRFSRDPVWSLQQNVNHNIINVINIYCKLIRILATMQLIYNTKTLKYTLHYVAFVNKQQISTAKKWKKCQYLFPQEPASERTWVVTTAVIRTGILCKNYAKMTSGFKQEIS